MRFSVFVLMLLLAAIFTGCKKKTCKDFKTGTFKAPDESINDITVIRKGGVQIETSEERNFKNEYFIQWVNDCEYYLVLKATNNPDKTLLSDKDTLRVSITGIEGDVYQWTAFLKDKKFVGDLKQVNND